MNAQICIDASIALQLILPATKSGFADTLFKKWDDSGIQIISPPIFDIDITTIIRKLMQMKLLTPQQGEQAFQHYQLIGINIINPPSLIQTAWDMTEKYFPAHVSDLHYLALTELVNAEFWTANPRLYSSLKDKNPRVRFLGDFSASPPDIPAVAEKKVDSHKSTRSDFPGLWRAI